MRIQLTLFALFFGLSALSAQQIDLTGQISIHNSRYQTGQIQYVTGASVEAPFAGSTSSGTEGEFDLTFNGVERGTLISLAVEKAGLEIVNERDLLNVILGRKQLLKVFLAKKGELAQRQTEFYDVSLAAITSRHDALIASLRSGGETSTSTMRELEEQFNKEFEHRYEVENLLNKKLETAKMRLPEIAKHLAEVNMDFVSSTYRSAYEAYLQGDIQSSLNILNEQELSKRTYGVLSALDEIVEGQQNFYQALEIENDNARQIYESYALKADAFELTFNYRGAAKVLKKGVNLMEKIKEEEDIELATSYNNLAGIYRNLGDYEKALDAQQKDIAIVEQILEPNHPSVAISYNNLALIYQNLGYYESALNAQQKALTIREQILEYNHPQIATSYNNIASIYKDLGYYEKALDAQQKALTIQEQVLEYNHPQLAASYNNLALIYKGLWDYKKALEVQQKALLIQEQILDANHPNIATSYSNLASIYQDFGDYEKALDAQQKDIAIIEQALDANHPSIATSYSNLASIYQDLGDYEKALDAQQKDIAIIEQTLDANHPSIATSYNNLASIYQDLGDYEKALDAQQKDIAIIEQALDVNHPSIATSYNNLASIYEDLGDYQNALVAQQKSLTIIEQVLVPNHPNIALSYSNLASIYLTFGDYRLAIANYRVSYRKEGISTVAYLNNTGIAYAKWGKQAKAKKCFIKLEKLLPNDGLPYRDWGLIYTLEGEMNIALENFEKAIELGYDNWEWFRTEESLDVLRDNPRFKALLEKAPTKSE